MPALPADIGAATREGTIAEWTSPTIKARYPSARDARSAPSTGYFDSFADAQTAIAQRGALIGVERRRFVVVVNELLWLDPVAGIPTVFLADGEQQLFSNHVVTRIELDLDAETTTLEVFG